VALKSLASGARRENVRSAGRALLVLTGLRSCVLALVFGGMLCVTPARALPAPDSASLARLQIQVVQLSRARVLKPRGELEIRKPFADESGIGSHMIVGPSRSAFVVLGQPEVRPTVHVSWNDVVEVQAPHSQALLYGTICGLLAAAPGYLVYAGASSAGYTSSGATVGVAIVAAGALAGGLLGANSPRWETIYPERSVAQKPWHSRLER